MIVDETIANLQAALKKLAEKDPQLAAHLELGSAVADPDLLPHPIAIDPATWQSRPATDAEANAWRANDNAARELIDAYDADPANDARDVAASIDDGTVQADRHDELATAYATAANEAVADARVLGAPIDPGYVPPVIGSPLWFLEEVAETYGQARTDYLVDELCGLKVVQREELSEPVLVFADGSWYTIVPEWARRTAEQIGSEDFARRVAAANVKVD